MKNRKCALFLFDGFADWEPALVTAGLTNYSDFSVVTFSLTGKPVISMGGLKINPQTSLDKINPADFDVLLLPGGEAWEAAENREIIPLIKEFTKSQQVIAAICGATISLGIAGLLDTIPHTSNSLEYLQQFCPDYTGGYYYQVQPCVANQTIITANGAAMIEFTAQIFRTFRILNEEEIRIWMELYKSGGMINKYASN